MTLWFPQWQGANQESPLRTGVRTLEKYYGEAITHRLTTESHTMQTSNIIHHYSAIHNHTLRCRELLKATQPATLFTIGGDCGVELIPVSYLNQRYENLGVVWFDAHADANTPASSPSKNFHGMPLRHLCGDGDLTLISYCFKTLQPQQIFYMGVRDVDRQEKKWIEEQSIFSSKEGSESLLIKALHQQNITTLYIHFDVDVLEPTAYPHALLPTTGGLPIERTYNTIKRLKEEFRVIGTSITEVTATEVGQLKAISGILDELQNEG